MRIDKKSKTKAGYKKILFLLLPVALVAAGFGLFWFNVQPAVAPVDFNLNQASVVVCPAIRVLDGQCVEVGQENLLPVALMIENQVEARPQAGLSQAQLVYEAVTEGGIPRFMAVSASNQEIPKIGPVRSARPYFVEWAGELGGLYLHCGGSPAALQKLDGNTELTDINEFYQGEYFWRDGGRAAPHNIYTSSELIVELKTTSDLSLSGDYDSWQFVDEATITDRVVTTTYLSFNYSSYNAYFTEWFYNPADNLYYREQAGEPHRDADGTQITAKNVVVQFIPAKTLDGIGRQEIKTVGEGKAIILKNGEKIEGTWEKGGLRSRTKFYDGAGVEIQFNRGTTWIEVIPAGREIVIK
ncbi:MAG: DUF3048 domain-containing protein [Patescibacteria group bacterium]|jgi:hypothetical protein